MTGVPSSLPQSFRVTDQTDPYETDDAHEDDEISDRKLASRILIGSLLIGITCGSALAWRWPFRFGAIPPAPVSSTTDAAPVGKPAGQGDLADLPQMITESTQESQRLLAAKDAEIKRLSDLVLALSSKLERMNPMTFAQGAMPMPTPGPTGAPTPAAAQRAAPHTAQKKLDPQKPVAAEQTDIRRAGR
jgi:hypothetical protein